jgi:hypothetical protein
MLMQSVLIKVKVYRRYIHLSKMRMTRVTIDEVIGLPKW